MLLCLILCVRCVRCQGALLRLWSHREGGPYSQLSSRTRCSAPRCSSASPQPTDVLFQQVWSKNRADLLPAFIAVLSKQGIHLIEQGRVKYRWIERLYVFIFDITPFKRLASLLSNLLLSYLGGTAGHCITQKELGTGGGSALVFPGSWPSN